MSTYIEPAIKSYFFGKGYTDLLSVIKESWKRNLASADDFVSKIKKTGEWYEITLSYIFFGGAALSVIIFGSIFFVVISLIHILLLGFLFLFIYIAFSLMWFIEKTYLFFNSFFAACPHCHEKNTIPEYLCDNCGSVHAMLMPNQYGIFHHKCTCGQKLPAIFFLNRGRLQARCPSPSCHQFLHRKHVESKKIFIPIFGGPSAGKTVFMFSSIRMLIEEKAKALGFTTEFIDKNTESEYQNIVNQIKKGSVPAKTLASIPKAFNIAFKKKEKNKWLLYLYDPSGEAYQNSDNLSSHHYHEYLSGMILIVDPFSIPAVRRYYENELSKTWSSVNPSQLDVDEVLSRVILSMENSYGLSKTGKIKKPLAVVITKIDAFGLEEILGEHAVNKEFKKSSNYLNRTELRNKLIRDKLSAWGEEALLHLLDTRFNNVSFFSCSALGRIPDSSENDFIPHNVFEPLSWLFNFINPNDFHLDEPETPKT